MILLVDSNILKINLIKRVDLDLSRIKTLLNSYEEIKEAYLDLNLNDSIVIPVLVEEINRETAYGIEKILTTMFDIDFEIKPKTLREGQYSNYCYGMLRLK